MTPSETKIASALVGLLTEEPFFANILMQQERVQDDSCDTMWTDGKRLGYSSKYVMETPVPVLESVLAHEALHVALGHHLRKGKREHGKWNEACDYVINEDLAKTGRSIPNWLYDPKYFGMTAETVYDRLQSNPEPKPENGEGERKPQPGEVREQTSGNGKGMDAAELAQAEAELQETVAQCAQSAKARGKLSGTLARFAAEAIKSKTTWQEILRAWFQSKAKDDYSWNRPNRRHLHSGMYLPSRHSLRMGKLVVAADWSGSIASHVVQKFAGELNEIVETVKPEEVIVIHFDYLVQKVERFAEGEEIILKAIGGGGTSFVPAMNWVLNNGERPEAMIYLTDCYGDFPPEPDFPVLWATVGGGAPFGEVIKLD